MARPKKNGAMILLEVQKTITESIWLKGYGSHGDVDLYFA